MDRLAATFTSLRSHNFRLFFVGQFISATGTWMQKLGQAWLVLELTGSGTLLGITAALQQLPTLALGLWGGLLADRMPKRRLLVATQSTAGALALVLGVLTASGVVELWMVLVLAFSLGSVSALDRPARKAFVAEMVPAGWIPNAVLLNSVMMNSARVLGPALAGLLISLVGLAGAFLLNGASYVAVVGGLLLMRRAELSAGSPVKRGRGQIRDGFRFILGSPSLAAVIALMAVAGIFAFEWSVTIPLLARDVLGGDAGTFGLLFSAMGLGAVLGGLAVASWLRANTSHLIRAAWLFSVAAGGVALSRSMPVALSMLILAGVTGVIFKALATALVHLRAPPEFRGRSLALLTVATTGTTPLGGPLAGWISESIGVQFAIGLGAVATAVAALVAAWYLRPASLRDERGSARQPRPCV